MKWYEEYEDAYPEFWAWWCNQVEDPKNKKKWFIVCVWALEGWEAGRKSPEVEDEDDALWSF